MPFEAQSGSRSILKTNIGQMRDLLHVQKPVTTSDGAGGYSVSNWQDVCEIWGNVQPVSSYEKMVSAQVGHEVLEKIIIRWRRDIKKGYRIVVKNSEMESERILEVVVVEYPNNKRRITLLHCKDFNE